MKNWFKYEKITLFYIFFFKILKFKKITFLLNIFSNFGKNYKITFSSFYVKLGKEQIFFKKNWLAIFLFFCFLNIWTVFDYNVKENLKLKSGIFFYRKSFFDIFSFFWIFFWIFYVYCFRCRKISFLKKSQKWHFSTPRTINIKNHKKKEIQKNNFIFFPK